jgi:hypothetical protein
MRNRLQRDQVARRVPSSGASARSYCPGLAATAQSNSVSGGASTNKPSGLQNVC